MRHRPPQKLIEAARRELRRQIPAPREIPLTATLAFLRNRLRVDDIRQRNTIGQPMSREQRVDIEARIAELQAQLEVDPAATEVVAYSVEDHAKAVEHLQQARAEIHRIRSENFAKRREMAPA